MNKPTPDDAHNPTGNTSSPSAPHNTHHPNGDTLSKPIPDDHHLTSDTLSEPIPGDAHNPTGDTSATPTPHNAHDSAAGNTSSPSAPHNAHHPAGDTLSTPSSTPTFDDAHEIQMYLRTLNKQKPKIEETLATGTRLVSTDADWTAEDPYIVDYSISDKNATSDEKFRTLLGAIGAADDFMRWEVDHIRRFQSGQKSRLETLCDDLQPGSPPRGNKKSSALTKYLGMHLDIFVNPERAKRAIELGLKYRVLCKLYSGIGTECPNEYHPDEIDKLNNGVLGLLFLSREQFRRLKYALLPALIAAIQSSDLKEFATNQDALIQDCIKVNHGNLPYGPPIL